MKDLATVESITARDIQDIHHRYFALIPMALTIRVRVMAMAMAIDPLRFPSSPQPVMLRCRS
jgi:hypothetical protein